MVTADGEAFGDNEFTRCRGWADIPVDPSIGIDFNPIVSTLFGDLKVAVGIFIILKVLIMAVTADATIGSRPR